MLSIIAELHFEGIRVVSVADGLDSDDEEATLAIQVRGIFNELQLRDLKKKTLRGQMGQKEAASSSARRRSATTPFPSARCGWTRRADRARTDTRWRSSRRRQRSSCASSRRTLMVSPHADRQDARTRRTCPAPSGQRRAGHQPPSAAFSTTRSTPGAGSGTAPKAAVIRKQAGGAGSISRNPSGSP